MYYYREINRLETNTFIKGIVVESLHRSAKKRGDQFQVGRGSMIKIPRVDDI